MPYSLHADDPFDPEQIHANSFCAAQAPQACPLLFAVVADGMEHGGATLSFQQRVYQLQVHLGTMYTRVA